MVLPSSYRRTISAVCSVNSMIALQAAGGRRRGALNRRSWVNERNSSVGHRPLSPIVRRLVHRRDPLRLLEVWVTHRMSTCGLLIRLQDRSSLPSSAFLCLSCRWKNGDRQRSFRSEGLSRSPRDFGVRKFEACHHICRIDHFCDRLLELLPHPRYRPHQLLVWGLRQIAKSDPFAVAPRGIMPARQ